jgi:oleandomycin transport system permease protein
MPSWLQGFVANQPVSQVIDATRYLMIGGNHPELFSIHDVWLALAWAVGLLVVMVPLAVRRYRRTA